ncbi:hypothetical protein D3C87_1682190 [compost metagenome]
MGLHTAGIYPLRLADVLRHLDWVGLDIKADAQGYDDITGRRDSHRPAMACLTQLLSAGTDFECRITWHPDWLAEERLLVMAQALARRGVRRFQPARRAHAESPGAGKHGALVRRIHLSLNRKNGGRRQQKKPAVARA